MNVSQDNNDRLVRLEENVKTLVLAQAKMDLKVDAVYEAFVKAQGAKYVVIVLWMAFGGVGLTIFFKLLALVGLKI
jgi:hypothetical protein